MLGMLPSEVRFREIDELGVQAFIVVEVTSFSLRSPFAQRARGHTGEFHANPFLIGEPCQLFPAVADELGQVPLGVNVAPLVETAPR